MPSKNPILTCLGCTDPETRKALPIERQCSACRKKERNRIWREQNPGAMAANARRWREAGNKSVRPEGYTEEHRRRERERYQNDPEHRRRAKEVAAVYRAAHPDKVRAANKAWRAKHIDEDRAYKRERMRTFYGTPEGKLWMKTMRVRHRAKRQARRAAYYAKRYGEAGAVTNEQLNWLHKWQDHCCCYCNAPLAGRETIEHVVPLNRGGENNPHNVLLACSFCNSSKQDRILDESEWLPDPSRMQTPARVFSRHATAAARKAILDAGIAAGELPEGWILLPGNLPLGVMSTFWVSNRSPDHVSVAALREKFPSAILTFDYEWLHRPAAVLNVVKAKCGVAPSTGARELEIEAPSLEETRAFMDSWHAQGFAGGFRYLGLRHKGTREWHGMASFRQAGSNFDLARLAFRDHVTGGLSRIMAAFRKTLSEPATLWTYADSRFGEGGGYLKAGFAPMGETNGWYGYANAVGLHSRQAYRKSRMATELDFFDPSWTERRLARANGLWLVEGLPQKRFAIPLA